MFITKQNKNSRFAKVTCNTRRSRNDKTKTVTLFCYWKSEEEKMKRKTKLNF